MRPTLIVGLVACVALPCADEPAPSPMAKLEHELIQCRRELVASWKAPPPASAPATPILLDPAELNGLVGQVVEVRGTVANTKIPSIAGLSLEGAETLRGKRVHLLGTVRREVVPVAPAEATGAKFAPIARFGPGVHYWLENFMELLPKE